MVRLDDIRAKIARREYEFSKHAVDQSIIRGISVHEIEDAISNRGEVYRGLFGRQVRRQLPDSWIHAQRKSAARAMQLPNPAADQDNHRIRTSP
jgi:hypothetical protein